MSDVGTNCVKKSDTALPSVEDVAFNVRTTKIVVKAWLCKESMGLMLDKHLCWLLALSHGAHGA